jgi:hypothetical protein
MHEDLRRLKAMPIVQNAPNIPQRLPLLDVEVLDISLDEVPIFRHVVVEDQKSVAQRWAM